MTGGGVEEIVPPWKDNAHPGRRVNQNNSDRRSPMSAWQFQQPAITKAEPMDNTDTPYQDQYNQYGTLSQTSTRNTCSYIPGNTLESTNISPSHNASQASNFLYRLPLTPPDSELNQGNSPSPPADTSRNRFTPNMASSPNNDVIVKQEMPSPERADFGQEPSTAEQNWSPQSSPDSRISNDIENLQQIVQRNTMFARERQSDDVTLKNNSKMAQPKLTASGKVKTYKCKNCSHLSKTKVEFWEHSRIHMKPDKILSCRLCPFVTEFKHHLEYHILNHSGQKPIECKQCGYRCINKSMLSSHAKCHSNVLQYRCMDCDYAAKYSHSLRQHLKIKGHTRSKVLNPDGTVNPNPIDVYTTRRGPKRKQVSRKPQQDPNQQNQQINQPPLPSNLVPPVPYMQPPFMLPPPEMQHFLQFGLPGAIPNPVFLHNIHRLVQEQQAKAVVEALIAKQAQENAEMETDDEVLDLSKPGPGPDTMRKRRKGLAHKIDNSIPDESSSDEGENTTTTMFSNVEVVQNEEGNSRESSNSAHQEAATQDVDSDNDNNKRNEYRCDHCGITFIYGILHTIHMGFHGFNDPFACNVCGKRCKDRLEFYTHILRPRHQRDDA